MGGGGYLLLCDTGDVGTYSEIHSGLLLLEDLKSCFPRMVLRESFIPPDEM